MYQYNVLYLAWWRFKGTETCRRIFSIDYQYILLCYWRNKLLYYCKTQRYGRYQRLWNVPTRYRVVTKQNVATAKSALCLICVTCWLVKRRRDC